MSRLAIAAVIVVVFLVIARWQRETVRPYLAEGDDGLLPMDPRLYV